ncbi:MAG: hypothetical protein HZA94_03750 [Candidatus Vogelbacteria bacterium]|nr:hypothetical protein [Candidatus Vogelbacteria bacterium]
MISRHQHKNLDWVDLESPSGEEIASIVDEYDIHPLIESELLKPSERAKVDLYPNFMYLILHFPKYTTNKDKESLQEIDFIVGKNFIVTAHYESVNALYDFSKAFETNAILNRFDNLDNAGILLYLILKALYENMEREMDAISNMLRDVEKKIFAGRELEMVEALSSINKTLIDFKHPIQIHKEILNSLEIAPESFFAPKFKHYIQATIGEYQRIWGRLESNKETVTDLRETNDSLFSAKTNSIMKNLTIMSFLTFPLALMVGILDMKSEGNPLSGVENQFWVVLSIMGTTTIIMLLFFRHRRWI